MTPPLCPASVRSRLRFLPLAFLPWHRDDRFPRSSTKPGASSRRLHAGCRWGSQQFFSPSVPGVISLHRFRHHLRSFDTSSAVHFRSSPDALPDRVTLCLLTSTLTTRALNSRRLRRFEICSCKPIPRGLPSSSLKHHTLNFYSTACVRGTRRCVPVLPLCGAKVRLEIYYGASESI